MNYYNEIKESLVNNEVYKHVKDYSKNKNDLETYYKVGELLAKAGKHYGEGIIKEYSIRLTKELDKKYSTRILYKMLKFYKFCTNSNLPTLSANLSWSHYDEILKLNNIEEIKYYIYIGNRQNLTIRELRNKIKYKEYERLPNEIKHKLTNINKLNPKDSIPNPILIKNSNNKNIITEKALHQLILEDIPSFLKELGTGYSFIDHEYKIKLGDRYNYIDLLLFNYEYNCFIVIELKITELKKEHIGQIQIYMDYIDKNLRKINQDKTIDMVRIVSFALSNFLLISSNCL